jgi:tripartite-type tricarboxylate transporter receptor subunit TctC
MIEVAYKGQPAGILDLLANRVQVKVASIGLVSEHVKAGQLKALAVIGKTRSALLPDVPTLAETGFPEINVVAWYGFAAPKATPKPVVDKIIAAFESARKDPKVRAALEAQGLQVVEPMTAEQLSELASSDAERLTTIIKDANIRIGP